MNLGCGDDVLDTTPKAQSMKEIIDNLDLLKSSLSVGEDVEKKEPLCTVGGNVHWCNHYGEQYGDPSKN